MTGWWILVVEDCLDIANLEAEVVRMSGGNPVVVSNGADALERLTDANFDLVLLDLDLPTVSGNVVLERMHQNPRLQRIPVIVVSGTAEFLRRTAQVIDVIAKPFQIDQLHTRICSALPS